MLLEKKMFARQYVDLHETVGLFWVKDDSLSYSWSLYTDLVVFEDLGRRFWELRFELSEVKFQTGSFEIKASQNQIT